MLSLPLLTAVLLSGAVSLAAWRLRFLSLRGALAAWVLGSVVWVSGQWLTALPLLFFFFTGSLLSKLPGACNQAEKSTQPRDAKQVMANGLVFGLLSVGYVLTRHSVFLPALYVSMAIATADTWSSEIGQRFGGKPIDILRFKRMDAGLSGGISWVGSVAGLLGAAAIAVLGWLMGALPGHNGLGIALAGVAGMLIDSLLGSGVQRKIKQPDGSWVEANITNAGGQRRGIAWVDNDLVNLFSNAITVMVWLWLYWY